MAGLAGFEADVDFADDGVEEYEHEPGGGRFGISGGIDASMTGEFDVSQLPPPPNVPPPPIPDFRAEGDFGGGETEGVVEKKKKKKKHREEGDEESGERRHRKKKKKHREGDGEDGERPRRHRRHRRDPTEEGEAPSAQPVLSADLTVGGNFEGDLLPPANQDLSYSEDIPLHTSHEVPPIDISHEIPQDYLVEPTQYEYEPEIPPENNFEVNVPNTAPPQDPEISGDLGFSHTQGYPEESWNRRSPSIEYNSPRVIADPNVGLDDHPSVEDYYTRGNNQNNRYPKFHQVVKVPSYHQVKQHPHTEININYSKVEVKNRIKTTPEVRTKWNSSINPSVDVKSSLDVHFQTGLSDTIEYGSDIKGTSYGREIVKNITFVGESEQGPSLEPSIDFAADANISHKSKTDRKRRKPKGYPKIGTDIISSTHESVGSSVGVDVNPSFTVGTKHSIDNFSSDDKTLPNKSEFDKNTDGTLPTRRDMPINVNTKGESIGHADVNILPKMGKTVHSIVRKPDGSANQSINVGIEYSGGDVSYKPSDYSKVEPQIGAASTSQNWNWTVPSYGEPEQVVDVTVPVLEEDRPQVEATLEAPHVEPISVSGVMAPPEEVNLDVVGTPEPIAVNGNFNFSGNPELHGDVGMMPGEPLEQQTMYSFNDPTMGPPPDSSFGQPQQPKQKGGLSKLFGFRKSTGKGKKKNEPEMQVSGPIVTGPANQPGSIPYGQSTIIGSPDSTIRSGGVQQDPWQSNPQLFNPNIDTLDPQMGLRGTLDQQPQLGGRGGKPGKKLPSNRPIPTNRARVILLDGEEIELDVDKKGNGRELVDRICDQLSIVERDYFGLTFFNRKEQTWFWLDVDKKVSKQLKHEEWLFNFQVKFYPPEPALIQEELTRYQLTLQVRQDIFTGKLPCSWVTQALLGSFLVQSELGDYDPDEHVGIDYVRQLEFVRGQNDQLLAKIVELHKNHRGMSPAQADLKYLETAKRLEQYGYDLHPAWDTDDVDIFIGISFAGVVVYRGPLRISRFAWPKVLRISYRKNFFYLKIRSECYDDFEAIVGFKLANNKLAKRLWKISVEHHTFFRLKEPRFAPKANIVPRFGSRYRYSGRTQFQYRTMSIDRENPQFDRSLTKRRTASMPMLAGGVGGSQYGSMHSLNRPHPRALTMNKTQSVEYLPQTTQPRTPSMGHRTGSMEFGGSIGGSFQNIPAQSGGPRVGMGGGGMPMQARVGGGTPIQVRSDDRPPVQARFENGTPISQRPSITSQSPAQAPRIQYHQRSDQVSLNGSEYSARGVRAGGVPLPYANVNIPQGRVRVGGSSVGSAAEDDLL